MSRRIRGAILAIVCLGSSLSAPAKGPTLTGLFPAGAARGQTATVTASGSFDRWPVKGWAEGEGIAIEAAPEKGKLTVRVADDAEPGVRWVRLWDDEGASAPRPFLIGTLPEVVEAEPNDDPTRPQVLAEPPATVNGRLARAGDVDGFSVPLRRGQTLVADLEANRHLGSPMDGVLQVASAEGFVLAQNDDAVGRDPRIVFEAPADGAYTVRLFAFPATPDSGIRFAGGDAFVYRLTLTTGGFLDHAFPLAVSRDRPATVDAIGPNIADGDRALSVPMAEDRDRLRVFGPRLAGTAEIRRVTGPSGVEVEPDDPAHPQAIPDRGAISGRIEPPGDRDTFRLGLKKGDRRVLRVESRALGLPLDAVLRLADAAGKTLAEADDSGERRDPEIPFTAPADGEYRISIRDLNDRGGPRFAYLLRVLAPGPDFSLAVASDRLDATAGQTTTVKVTIDRKEGYDGPIEVVAEDLPDGLTAGPAVSKPGDASAKAVSLTLSADGRARPGPFRIVGKAAGGRTRRAARVGIAGFDAATDRMWLTIHASPAPGKP